MASESRLSPVLAWVLRIALFVLPCGCKCSPEATLVPPKTPSIRLYFVSSWAGALEPCGCVKDMLGGIDHLAAYLNSGPDTPHSRLLLGAGPLLFMSPTLSEERRTQETWKADTLARALGGLSFGAWAPGANDWAAGADTLGALSQAAHAGVLAANLKGPGVSAAVRVFELGGTKLGVAGVSLPEHDGALPAGVSALDLAASLERAKADLDAQGARIHVLLAALPRGDALRLIERVPGFDIALIGKPFDVGEANDAPTPPDRVGKTLVVQTPNHLQAIAEVDLFVRGDSYDFEDGSNIEQAAERDSVASRVADLEARLGRDAGSAADRAAGQSELSRLRARAAQLERAPTPKQGSFFRYRLLEVREKLGSDRTTHALLDGYYQRVNEHNREVFKDLLPRAAGAGESSFVGAQRCAACHRSEYEFWVGTRHAEAYETLSVQHKQFNLDCVSCHVTGYDQPGGSTVTHVQSLEDVQCEVCHGAGSRHAENPADPKLVHVPEQSLCAGSCHHPPHVKSDWNVSEAWLKIVGPGHQKQ